MSYGEERDGDIMDDITGTALMVYFAIIAFLFYLCRLLRKARWILLILVFIGLLVAWIVSGGTWQFS